MARNMSFAMTIEQMRSGTKSITRRFGWLKLKPGQIIWAVEKAMGLKKGEKIKRICAIKIISTKVYPLEIITYDDVVKEGFPGWTPEQFITMVLKAYPKKTEESPINRIEFEILGWVQ